METGKEKRIKAEIKRLVGLFSTLPQNEQDFIRPQLENAAFMRITLEDLQQQINENGTSDDYKNGENQFGKKASADLQAYNSTIKNYTTLMDKLIGKLPKGEKENEFDTE